MEQGALGGAAERAVFLAAAVKRVADERMAEFGGMDADLVGATGFDDPLHKTYAVVGAQYPIMRNRRPPFDRLVDRTLAGLGRTVHDGQVDFAHLLVRLEEPAELAVRRWRFGEHHDAGGIPVEPVDDAGAIGRAYLTGLG